ncbi:hypothetical protein [Streptomyces roseicoloratus]|uniref:hypothetical protein n=1 Tax=Streptomyces roseicoloratus TaxID=2508722 RepID=UPI001009D0BF|nr:hypothetical protein [Streptomyces roseicoloratus]
MTGSRTRAVLAAAALLAVVTGCTARPAADPAARTPTPRAAPGPWGRDRVVSAECLKGARYVAVRVQSWDPGSWKPVAERLFDVPESVAFWQEPGKEAVLTPLFDLCRENPTDAVYTSDALERVVPRVRAVFDRDFTRMAVVLRTSDGRGTHVGFVDAKGLTDLTARDARPGASRREQNAVLAPDGSRVWFTYETADGRARIGSRSVTGGAALRDEGPAAAANLPLVVLDGPPARAVQAEMVHVSPDGRRITAATEGGGPALLDVPARSTALTEAAAGRPGGLGACLHAVGWSAQDRLLCRTRTGAFRTFGTAPGAGPGPVLTVAGGAGGEGLVVSPDGSRFLLVQHPPGDPYAGFRGFRVAGTEPGAPSVKVPAEALNGHSLFLEWR